MHNLPLHSSQDILLLVLLLLVVVVAISEDAPFLARCGDAHHHII